MRNYRQFGIQLISDVVTSRETNWSLKVGTYNIPCTSYQSAVLTADRLALVMEQHIYAELNSPIRPKSK